MGGKRGFKSAPGSSGGTPVGVYCKLTDRKAASYKQEMSYHTASLVGSVNQEATRATGCKATCSKTQLHSLVAHKGASGF